MLGQRFRVRRDLRINRAIDLDVEFLLHGEREHRPYGEGRIDVGRQVDALDVEIDLGAAPGAFNSIAVLGDVERNGLTDAQRTALARRQMSVCGVRASWKATCARAQRRWRESVSRTA